MNEIPPSNVTDCIEFPPLPFPVSITSNVQNSFGHVSKDGSWAWLAHKSVLEIFSTKTKERCGVCYFRSPKSDSLTITAVTELCSSHLSFPCLVVGLESSKGGLVNLFNVKTSKVINSIRLPNKVTSLAVISGTGGATMETHPLSPQLRFFFGIIAVGTERGNVLLIDLCLDGDNYTDEYRPNKVIIIHKRTHNLPAKREQAIEDNKHLCIFLNDSSFKLDVFEYQSNHKVIATLPADDVIVTSIKYLRHLAILIVGFNFGGMQLWNLQQLHFEFSLPYHLSQPLVHFAFQEPENDPRNFCYLWVIHGYHQGENFRPEAMTTATLYCLNYAKKDWIPRYGYLYRNLECVTKSFQYTLSKDPYNYSTESPTNCSRLITCDVIPQPGLKLEAEDSIQSDESGFAEDLSLCVMAWENWSGAKPVSSCLVLFDINQWYHAQQPSSIRRHYGMLCSYLGVFSLNDVSSKMCMDPVMSVSIVPNSLSRFKCPSVSEQMFFPSSFSFKIRCFSAANFLEATYLGIQRQIFSEMNADGPSVLIEPKKLYDWCSSAGLINPMSDVASGSQLNVGLQRETLLSLALENNMLFFLDQCVQKWHNAEFLLYGCSSKFLLEWLWKTVTKIKGSTDKLCTPLFDGSVSFLEEKSLLLLRTYESQLKHLSDILLIFQHLPGPKTTSGQQELLRKNGVIDQIAIYLHTIIWLCDCRLLPESDESYEYGEDKVIYPASRLHEAYAFRRKQLQKIHNSIGKTDLLMIDGLVDEFGSCLTQTWQKKGGTSNYPPASIYAAISVYLLESPSLSQKHLLTCYLLLDVMNFVEDRQAHLLEKLASFGTSNNVPLHLCKLAQAFWHLDHCDFEMALNHLLDPMILATEISSSQQVRILKSFLYQNQPQKALTYLNARRPIEVPREEVKLHLSILLSNGFISEALSYQRQYQDGPDAEDLLKHFFLGCQETYHLHDALQLPLNAMEHDFLSEYLLNCSDPQAPEILVMYNLLRGNPLEAADLNEKLVSQTMDRNFKSQERAAARNALVNGFVNTLPEEQKKLAQELNQIYSQLERKEAHPTPLSTRVTNKSLDFISYADLLRDIIGKCQEANQTDYTEQSPLKTTKTSIRSTPFICSPFTKKSESRKRPAGASFVVPAPKKSVACTENYMTPLKKPHGSKVVSTFRALDVSDFGGMRATLNNEINSLLQTPPICRKKPKTKSSETSDAHPKVPSHSILKTKSTVERAPSLPPDDYFTAKTPSICSESEKDEEMPDNVFVTTKDQDEKDFRQLRFKVPSPENYIPSYQPVTNLGRKPLHDESRQIDSPRKLGFMAASDMVSHLVAERSQEPLIPEEPADDYPSIAVELETKNESFSTENESFHLHLSDSEPESEKQMDCNSSEASVDVISVPVIDDNRTSTPVEQECLKYVNVEEEQELPMSSEESSLPASVEDQPQVTLDKDSYIHEKITSYDSSSLKSASSSDSLSVCSSVKTTEVREVVGKYDEKMYQEASMEQEHAVVTKSTTMLSEKWEGVTSEAKLSPEKRQSIMEAKETELNTSPYMGTRSRSRSKSISPSRSLAKTSPIHSQVKPLLHKDIQKDSSGKMEKGSSEESLMKSNLPPVKEREISPSPYLGTRSKSKSLSPSRTKTTKQASVKYYAAPIQETEPHVRYIDKLLENKPFELRSSKKTSIEDELTKGNTSKGSRFDDARKIIVASVSSCLSSETIPEARASLAQLRSQPSTVSSLRSEVEAKTPSLPAGIGKVNPVSTFLEKNYPSHTKTGTEAHRMEEKTERSPQKSIISSRKKPQSSKGKGSAVKKKTVIGKIAQKLEFSFSAPRSSADSRILEALAKSPPTPVAPFIFSPPSTRARVRQKKMNETLNASIASPVATPDKLIFDPLLYEERDEFALPPPPLLTEMPSSQSKRRTKKHIKTTDMSTPKSNVDSSALETGSSKSSARPSTRLSNKKPSMVLRNSATKKK